VVSVLGVVGGVLWVFLYISIVNAVGVVSLMGFDPLGSEVKGYECVIVSFVAFGTNGVKIVMRCWVTMNNVFI